MNFIMTTFSQTIGSETKASPINALSIQSLPAAKARMVFVPYHLQ
uniref:Uncharacterized protein n=1 Tax=Trichinella nativa TaxID=6335 RepID=A0A0V1KI16_9BILA